MDRLTSLRSYDALPALPLSVPRTLPFPFAFPCLTPWVPSTELAYRACSLTTLRKRASEATEADGTLRKRASEATEADGTLR